MEQLKHECGVALIRLRRPLQYYKEKYGTYAYALNKLYLLMEKQHNRGQEAAGLAVVKTHAPAGHELIFRERALGKDAIPIIFDKVRRDLPGDIESLSIDEVEQYAPFVGEIYMGHLRYSTTGRSGLAYAHPVLRRNNWRSRSLALCGNFNMTNTDEIFEQIVATGQHPRLYSDSNMLLEQIGYMLDKENHRLYRQYRDELHDPDLARAIEDNLDIAKVLRDASPAWDGGFVICGATGSGDCFALRDPHGIRPAFYYYDDDILVVASERPVIRTSFDLEADDVHELTPGSAIMMNSKGDITIADILGEKDNRRCSFERIYFSRGSDEDIYRERKELGRRLVPEILTMIDHDIDNAVFSFIPNTAEVAFIGMVQGLEEALHAANAARVQEMIAATNIDGEAIARLLQRKVRVEKVAIKDVKMRTFISEGSSRDDMAAHVYDVTYGSVRRDSDTLIVIDDSIVRGTTLRQSILRMLDRVHPARIIIVSSSPQVRYPDYYGIDMSSMDQFIAFKAAVELLKESGREHVLHDTYQRCLEQTSLPAAEQTNCVKAVYEPFSDVEISAKIAAMLKPAEVCAKVDILYLPLADLHKAIPGCPGDWYFSGDYPTPGGVRQVNRAYIDYYEANIKSCH